MIDTYRWVATVLATLLLWRFTVGLSYGYVLLLGAPVGLLIALVVLLVERYAERHGKDW